MAHYYNQNLHIRLFKVGDCVLRRVSQGTKNPNKGVLGPSWEGLYRVLRVASPGVYKLDYPDGQEVKKSWNAEYLKKVFLVSFLVK